MWKKCKNLVYGKSVAVDFLWLVTILFHKNKIATVGKKNHLLIYQYIYKYIFNYCKSKLSTQWLFNQTIHNKLQYKQRWQNSFHFVQYLTNNVCKSLNKSSAITLKSSCIKQMKHSNDHITGISTLSIERTWVGMTCFKRKKRKELLNYYGIFCCSISNTLKYHNFSCLSQIKFIHCLTTVSLLKA